MSLHLYMDVHVRSEITAGLRLRGVDVLTAQEDGNRRAKDPALLDRAGALGRVLFTSDKDFLIEATRRQRAGESFAGVVYIQQLKVNIGRCIDDLELLAKVLDPAEMADSVFYLPL